MSESHSEKKIYTFDEVNRNGHKELLVPKEDNSLRKLNTLLPQYLIFNLKSNISINEFINNLEMSNFKLNVENNIIVNILLSLYANLNPVKIISYSNSCSVIITISFDTTFGCIDIIRLYSHQIRFKLNICQYLNDLIDNVQLSCELTYINRTSIIQDEFRTNIQEFESLVIKLDIPELQIMNTLNFGSASKGIFVENNNISNICNIKICFNGFNRIDYNKNMLELYTVKISDNLIYILFDNNIRYTDRSIESFYSGINFDYFDVCDITITFIIPDNNINIYSIRYNQMMYEYGTGIQRYSYNTNINISNFNGFNRMLKKNLISWKSKNKLISENSRNIECPITYEEIKINDRYCECKQCKYNILYKNLLIWFDSRATHSCPMCRTNWSYYVIYINDI